MFAARLTENLHEKTVVAVGKAHADFIANFRQFFRSFDQMLQTLDVN